MKKVGTGRATAGILTAARRGRRWLPAAAFGAALLLQACGGGNGEPVQAQATERPAATASAALAPSATAVVVDAVSLTAPDGRSAYAIEQYSDGVLKLTARLASGISGDIRAFYFHMAGDNVQGLVVSGPLVTGLKVGTNAVTQVLSPDTKLSRQSGVVATGGFDVGVEIGTKSTSGTDDVQVAELFLSRTGGALSLADIRYASDAAPAYFGLVARSVGMPGTRRGDEINVVFEPGLALAPPAPARAYEVGAEHLCYATQLVNCLGSNANGQAPLFGTSFVLGAKAVAAGVRHSCAIGQRLVNGAFVDDVACWGEGTPLSTAELAKPALPGVPTKVAAGDGTTCVLTDAGSVICWAATADATALHAYTVAGAFIDLAVGGARTCAVDTAGAVACWDKNTGVSAGGAPANTGPFTQVDAFGGVACATTSAAGAQCWSNTLAAFVPNMPSPSLTGVTQVAVGAGFACALVADGKLICWDTEFTSGAAPVVPTGLINVGSIEAGGGTLCANMRVTGEVHCWGDISATLFGPLS